MIRTEFRGFGRSEFKVVIFTNSRNPENEWENRHGNNSSFDLFSGMNEQTVNRYLEKLCKDIAKNCAEFVEGVKKINGSANVDELRNLVHENNPSAAFKVENVSFEPTTEEVLQLRQQLVREKRRTKMEYEQKIEDLNKRRDTELKMTKDKIEKSLYLEISNLQSYLENSCTEMLQNVIKECFSLNEDDQPQGNNDSRVECNIENNEVTSSVRLSNSNPTEALKHLQKPFDEVLNGIRKVYQDEMNKLKTYFKKENDRELREIKSRIIESLYAPVNRNIANSPDTSVSSVSSRMNETRANDPTNRNSTKSTDKSIHCDKKINERIEVMVKKKDPVKNADIKVDEPINMTLKCEKKPYALKVRTDLHPTINVAGPSSLLNMEVEPEQNFPFEELQEPLILDIEMTDNAAKGFLKQLPKEQADRDSHVSPFPIRHPMFTDEYWTDKRKLNEPKEVQKFIKMFFPKYKFLKQNLNSEMWQKYEEYRKENKKCCWEVRCMLRNKRFPTNNHLHAHIKKYHPNGRTIFPCTSCGLPFPNNEVLKKHRDQRHPKKPKNEAVNIRSELQKDFIQCTFLRNFPGCN